MVDIDYDIARNLVGRVIDSISLLYVSCLLVYQGEGMIRINAPERAVISKNSLTKLFV